MFLLLMDKAEKFRELSRRFYRQKTVQKALLEAGRNKEVVPRYYESFGKRPDVIFYDGDVKSLVDKGATSFHCSEERWQDPLKLSAGLTKQELDFIENKNNWGNYFQGGVRVISEKDFLTITNQNLM